MTERLYWEPENPNEEPFIRLNVGDKSYELTRDNTTLHTFLGKLAVFNHLFYSDEHNQEVREAFYLFSDIEVFPQLEEYVRENDYPAVINQTEVSSVDQDAYIRQATRDFGDHVPEEWLEEKPE